MALYLLGQTFVKKNEVIVMNGQEIYAYYSLLAQIFSKYCHRMTIAEPVISHKTQDPAIYSVSWYIDGRREPEQVAETQQDDVHGYIQEAYQTLQKQYAADSLERQLIETVFHVQDKQDVLIVDDQIFLKGWGSSPENGTGYCLIDEENPLKKQHVKDQSQYSSDLSQSMNNAADARSSLLDSMKKTASMTVFAKSFYHSRLVLHLVAACVFFIIGLWLGWRLIYAERPKMIAGKFLQEARALVQKKPEIERRNLDLKQEIEALKQKIRNPPCDLKKMRADPVLNKNLNQSVAPMTDKGRNFKGSLPDLLEKSTVLVLALHDQDNLVSSGTGFFVTSDEVVTNRHVVEDARDNKVAIINKSLGHLTGARIISVSQSEDIGGLDLAVLKVDNAPPQQPLSFSLYVQPLQDVVAAGYPGMLTEQDDGMKRLLHGDVNSIPGIIMTEGQVNAIQQNSRGEKIIPHSAMVSPGNSGGPLVDLCGRVIGVNTFVTMDQHTASHGNYAQKSDAIIRALQMENIPVQVQSDRCNGQVGSVPVPDHSSSPSEKGQIGMETGGTSDTSVIHTDRDKG